MWLKEENGQLIPPPINYQSETETIFNFYKNPEKMRKYGWREWTRNEYDAWFQAHPEPPQPELET